MINQNKLLSLLTVFSLIFVFLLNSSTVCYSQNRAFRSEIGINYASIFGRSDDEDVNESLNDTKDKLRGKDFSFYTQFYPDSTFSWRTGLRFLEKGYAVRDFIDNNDVERKELVKVNFTFFELPLEVQARLIERKNFQMYAVGGVFIGYMSKRRIVEKEKRIGVITKSSSKDVTIIPFTGINEKRVDAGVTIGLGLSYELPFGVLFLETDYKRGLINLEPDPEPLDLPPGAPSITQIKVYSYSRGVGLSLGISVALTK